MTLCYLRRQLWENNEITGFKIALLLLALGWSPMKSLFRQYCFGLSFCFQILTYRQILERGRLRKFQRAGPCILRKSNSSRKTEGTHTEIEGIVWLLDSKKKRRGRSGSLRGQKSDLAYRIISGQGWFWVTWGLRRLRGKSKEWIDRSREKTGYVE